MLKLKDHIKNDAKYSPLVYADLGLEIFVSDCAAIGFTSRSTSQPLFNYRFKSHDARNEYLAKFVAKYRESAARMAEYKGNQKVLKAERIKEFRAKLKVGTILSDSWGYEQTNVEFYKILAVEKSRIQIVELGHIQGEAKSWASCDVTPSDTTQGEPIWKQVRTDHIPICSSIHLTVWDGKPKYKSWYY